MTGGLAIRTARCSSGGTMLRKTSGRLLIPLAIMTALGGGTAAAQSSAPAVSFSYMTFVDQESDMVGSCIDDYMALHPNVTIDYQVVDHDALQQKLVTQVETNTLPDMFWWNGTLIIDAFNKSESVLDLTPYLDDAFKDNLIDGALTNLTNADGKVVGFPAEVGVQGWVFNQAVFDEYDLTIPTTYDELKAVVPIFRENGVDTIAYGSKEGWAVWGFQHWLVLWGIWQQADAVFKDHSLKSVDSDFKKAYEAEAELYALGAFPADNSTMGFDQAVSLF
ncbi:MAG: ABC transporter substrate-binding protein, partial [Chloroflexi bacterium]|nr:ABC transporter substrate-binding protein [Chloroflexota bacterium]